MLPQDSDKQLKHLEFIQGVINRMARNSFLIKGWSVTLVAALFAFTAKASNLEYMIIAYLPVLIFWILDGYYLSQERLFRALYDDVRLKQEEVIDFSMDTRPFNHGRNTWIETLFSRTLLIFYGVLVATMLIVTYLVGKKI